MTAPDQVDAKMDVYSLGAVAYFLLTGTPVFTGVSVMEICMKHVKEQPQAPSARLGKPVSPDLEGLLLRCLAKAPLDRPRHAAELLCELETCTVAGVWTAKDAAGWWAANEKLAHVAAESAATRAVSSPATPAPETTMAYEGDRRAP
jgi:serine/threonine-protein kinase